jgi:hypothetical protein
MSIRGCERTGLIGSYLHGAFENPTVLAEIGTTANIEQGRGTEELAD